jgi:hypothetical protein
MPDSPPAPGSSEAVLLGMDYGNPAVLRPIPGFAPLRDDTLRWFGGASVPMTTRLRFEDHITRMRRLAEWAVPDADDPVRRHVGPFDFEPVLDPEEVGY